MGLLSTWDLRPANNYQRSGDVFLAEAGTDAYYYLGEAQGITVNAEPFLQEPDSHQRIRQAGFDVTIEFMLRQTGYADEFANLDGLLIPTNNADGFRLKITDCGIDPGDPGLDPVETRWATNATAAVGTTFDNVYPQVGTQLDFNGAQSLIPVTITGRVGITEWIKLGNAIVSFKRGC